jgi:hypothetical protein
MITEISPSNKGIQRRKLQSYWEKDQTIRLREGRVSIHFFIHYIVSIQDQTKLVPMEFIRRISDEQTVIKPWIKHNFRTNIDFRKRKHWWKTQKISLCFPFTRLYVDVSFIDRQFHVALRQGTGVLQSAT